MKIAISAESTIDMPKDLLSKYNIHTVPFTVVLGNEEYLDGEISSQQIFDYVKKTNTLPKTSAVNNFQYEEHFKNLLKDYDAIIHLSLSSEISSAYSNANTVSKEFENVYVIDTKSLSTGIALLAIKASEAVKEGLDIKEILNLVLTSIPKVQVSFVIDKLQFLYKGGRCSALASFGSNLLSIKPQIIVKNGKMQVGKKYIGKFENVIFKYCNDLFKDNTQIDLSNVFITYTTAPTLVVDKIKDFLQTKGFKNIYVTHAGGTISSHCGANTLGILFIKE